ncbi:MAG: UDP-N-acetylmuramoyl-L-alanyl-D-glutamate--2,6-diaminopimelate ligase [Polyangiaceae bacterium]|nr:UDP-N-acetylmuramoyl-L-alanyl-D-glutamate--2,6-diaminopimelate ligase [Polyangiaceae bacterium]
MTHQRSTHPPPVTTPPPRCRLLDLVREIAGATVLAPRAGWEELVVTGVHHDSRAVEAGDVFVAREGGRVNGLAFVDEAVRRGACAVVARRAAISGPISVPIVEVDDVPVALAFAAAAVYGHPTFGLDVVGVTGTNGKTTTTLLCRAMIDHTGGRCGVIGTLGSEFEDMVRPTVHTSPEADELARIARAMRDRGATHLAMEVSSIALTARRADAVRFRVAAFSNLTQDHLDFHGTMEAYADAKARLFTELSPSSSAINVRDAFGRQLVQRLGREAHAVTFSSAADIGSPDVHPTALTMHERGISMTVRTPLGDVTVDSPLIGAHNVENLLCAVAIGVCLGLEPKGIGDGLSQNVRVPGRLERCDDPDVDDVVVLVDYAHTPDALERVLQSVRPFAKGRLVCLFGCGGDRDPMKRPLMGRAAGDNADFSYVTNDNPRSEDPAAIASQIVPGLAHRAGAWVVELDRRAAIRRAVSEAAPGDVVVVAGKGHETYQIIGAQTFSFDDREVAKEALAARREKGGAQ